MVNNINNNNNDDNNDMVCLCSFKIKAYLLQGLRISNNLQLVSIGGVSVLILLYLVLSVRIIVWITFVFVCLCIFSS